jgi:hypothetical protein
LPLSRPPYFLPRGSLTFCRAAARLTLEKKMKAAVVREFGQPLVMEDRPIPSPGRGQVTVRMEASGLCHTDIHSANGGESAA